MELKKIEFRLHLNARKRVHFKTATGEDAFEIVSVWTAKAFRKTLTSFTSQVIAQKMVAVFYCVSTFLSRSVN